MLKIKLVQKLIIQHRALSKTITWRLVASILTISIVYLLTHNLILALSVIGIEFITKMILYYFHEKSWSYNNRPKKGSQLRSFIKTVTWRILASLDTFVILFIILKEPILASSGAGLEVIAKSIAYYIHERIWDDFRLEKVRE